MEIPLCLNIGELISRPNRFIFEGIADGQLQRWHCPVTGKIGMVDDFRGMPCLFSQAVNREERKTQGTVEAISLNHGIDWIGINQNRINGWIEALLRKNAFPTMVNTVRCSIHREIKVDDSRIDILVDNGERRTFLELKTPIHDFLLSSGNSFTQPSSETYFDRGLRHFKTLAKLAQKGHRAIVAICFMYDAIPFDPPKRDKWNAKIIDTISEATANGVENWQINLKIFPCSLKVSLCTQILRRDTFS
ncbi:MAG: DNA/RNA nuclease SfsA [Puniceicoccales bacterium]|jgi:sugar fermentation stimulation protein A|nr:DNA/RNA nuclease SfsA [Puniceicoccales bacterium]